MTTAQVLSLTAARTAEESLNGICLIPVGKGAKSLLYLGCPPTDTVNKVRP